MLQSRILSFPATSHFHLKFATVALFPSPFFHYDEGLERWDEAQDLHNNLVKKCASFTQTLSYAYAISSKLSGPHTLLTKRGVYFTINGQILGGFLSHIDLYTCYHISASTGVAKTTLLPNLTIQKCLTP